MSESETNAAERLHPGIWVGWFALVLWGLFPFRVILDHYPWKVDAIKWVTQGALDNPDWPRWVFRSHHFVGYRPVAAGSFVADHALAGFSPAMYRLTDFALHALVALGVLQLAKRWMGATAWVLLPVLIYVGHPAIEEALPYLARRSYLLAMVFSTFGLATYLDALRHPRPVNGYTWGATGLLALGLLSNEVAYVTLPMLPLLAWHERSGDESTGRWLLRSVLPWIPAIPAVAMRYVVLGWSGGYTKPYFAFAKAGKKVLREVEAFNFHEIVGASYDYLWFPVSFKGAETITEPSFTVFAIASFYAWATLVEPVAGARDRARRMPLLLLIWFTGYGMLYGLSKTWFWRQGYPMVVPLALLVGWVAWDTATRYRTRRLRLVALLVPQSALVVGLLWHSPLFRGMTTGPINGRFEGNRIVHLLDEHFEARTEPALVYTVLGLNKGSTRNVHTWLNRLHDDRDIQYTSLARGLPAKNIARLEGADLVLGSQARIPQGLKRSKGLDSNRVPLSKLHLVSKDTYLVFPGPDGWEITPTGSR